MSDDAGELSGPDPGQVEDANDEFLMAGFYHERFEAFPFGSPDYLAACNEEIPDGAERLVSWMEREQAHRHDIDARRLSIEESESTQDHTLKQRGQLFGVISVGMVVACASYLATSGQENLANSIFLITAILVAGLFVSDRATTAIAMLVMKRDGSRQGDEDETDDQRERIAS